jgi:hypothetical protein
MIPALAALSFVRRLLTKKASIAAPARLACAAQRPLVLLDDIPEQVPQAAASRHNFTFDGFRSGVFARFR